MREDLTRIGQLRGVIDVELTNRCNASCGFCPRDQTPHEGVMSMEVLEAVVRRVVELRQGAAELWPGLREVSFCGLGDQLIHPAIGGCVRMVRDVGFDVSVNTNGFLLDERRGTDLLEADVTNVYVNGGAIGDAYEALYQLPFDRVRDNVERFAAQAEGRCQLYIVLVDHDGQGSVNKVRRFWKDLGVTNFFQLGLINRAGALEVADQDYDALPTEEAAALLATRPSVPACRTPFQFPFIGYDGRYYLCSSDWRKEVSVGNVLDHTILDVVPAKVAHVRSREPICRSCTHDPTNRLAVVLAARAAGTAADADVEALLEVLDLEATDLDQILTGVQPHLPAEDAMPAAPSLRRRIPASARARRAVLQRRADPTGTVCALRAGGVPWGRTSAGSASSAASSTSS